MPEIKTKDIQEIQKPSSEGFRSIQPESGLSFRDACNYLDSEIKYGRTGEIGTEFLDDNGVKYRTEDRLEPNATFERRGFIYTTDEFGRVTSTKGKLRIPDHVPERKYESMDTVGKGDELPTDERGHLIGRQFGASDGMENLSAMDADLNHGDYARLERKWSSALKEGADVRVMVEPQYESESSRPTQYRISYTIDGEKSVVVFRNERVNNHDE